MSHTDNHEKMNERDELFASQNELLDSITSRPNGYQQFLDRLSASDAERLFGLDHECNEKCSCCVDEGIPLQNNEQGCARIAGSGILLGKERAQKLWQAVGLTEITAHEGCGAAALYCQAHAPNQANPSQYVADILRSWAEEVGLKFKYISTLDRPAYHSARAIVVDTTDSIRPNDVLAHPKAFVVTADGSSQEIIDDVLLSAGIAFGDHAFGDRFTAEHPLLISLVGNGQNQAYLQQIAHNLQQDERYIINQARLNLQFATAYQLAQEYSQAAD